VVIAFDTTQSTAADRIKLYVNGAQVTAFGITNNPVQNANYAVNSAAGHEISRNAYSGSSGYYDGEMAEINFVDGYPTGVTQALWASTNIASSFGATSANSQWLPKAYTGTYGTNGFYLPFNSVSTSSFAGSFNGSNQYLNVNSVTAVGTGDFTVETFVYFNTLGDEALLQLDIAGVVNNWQLSLDSTANKFRFFVRNDLATTNANLFSSAAAVTNQWYHVAGVVSGTTATLYVNGISVASATLSGIRSGTGTTLYMGQNGAIVDRNLNGYMSNSRYVKGTAVYTANFTPPTANLTNITNTVLLTLQNATIVDNSSNGYTITNNNTVVTSVQYPFTLAIAADSSGNANNWTPNNISLTAGSTYDSLTDVPTLTSATVANYCVLSPLSTYNAGGTLSNGNLTVSLPDLTNNKPTMATDTGKWYAEFTCVSAGGYSGTGLAILTSGASTLQPTTLLRTEYVNNGQTYSYSAGAYVAYGSSWTDGDVIGVAWDCSAAQVTFYKNGVSQGTLSSPSVSLTTGGSVFNFVPSNYNTTVTTSFSVNYGQQPWKYSLPSGFLALNTFNI